MQDAHDGGGGDSFDPRFSRFARSSAESSASSASSSSSASPANSASSAWTASTNEELRGLAIVVSAPEAVTSTNATSSPVASSSVSPYPVSCSPKETWSFCPLSSAPYASTTESPPTNDSFMASIEQRRLNVRSANRYVE